MHHLNSIFPIDKGVIIVIFWTELCMLRGLSMIIKAYRLVLSLRFTCFDLYYLILFTVFNLILYYFGFTVIQHKSINLHSLLHAELA